MRFFSQVLQHLQLNLDSAQDWWAYHPEGCYYTASLLVLHLLVFQIWLLLFQESDLICHNAQQPFSVDQTPQITPANRNSTVVNFPFRFTFRYTVSTDQVWKNFFFNLHWCLHHSHQSLSWTLVVCHLHVLLILEYPFFELVLRLHQTNHAATYLVVLSAK